MNVLNFDSKQCERVRRQLDAYVSNELLVETTSEVLKHLEAHICSVPGSPRNYVHFIARGRGTILSVILTKHRCVMIRRRVKAR